MRIEADLLDMSVLQHEVQRRALGAGLSVQFVAGLDTPHYDPTAKMVKVPRIKPPSTLEDLDYLRGSIIHEIGHANRVETIERAAKFKIDMTSPFGKILNIIEDGALERDIAGEWYGDAQSLGIAHEIHIRRMCDNISKHVRYNPGATFGDNTKPNAVHVLGERYRKWDRWSEGTRARIDTTVPPDCKAIADALDKEGFGPKMVKARSTNQVFDLAKEMYKKLYPEDEKDPEDPKSDQNYQGESKEDEAKRKAKAGKPAEGEGKDGEGKGEGKGKPKVSVIPWTMLDSDHTETGTPNPNAKIDYSDHHYNRTQPLVMPITIRKPTSEQCSVPKAPSFIGRLRILLQSEKKCKFEFGLTSGKLDQRKLSKLALPIVPGSDSWRHVFKKRIPGKKINTCVQILVDGSGSMSGKKNEIAADAADIMNQAFAGPLRIKTAVHGFDAHSNNIIYPIKEFNENVLPGQIASRGRGVGFGGNADGDALLWGLGNIIGRPEKRKIIIVLSDGMPSSSSRVVDPGSMLKYAIDAARKRGVQVYGIGIEDDSVKHFYGKDCKVIKSAAELPQAIIDTLKAAV